MKSTITNSKIGEGIYSVPDIAFLLSLPVPKVRRWLKDFWNIRIGDKTNHSYSWGEGKSKACNFYTLIEFYVFYSLKQQGVSQRKIFDAHFEMSQQLRTVYPFASAKVLTDGKSILYRLNDVEGTTVNADKSKQIALKEIIDKFCKKIDFANNNLAENFYPLGKAKSIVVNPHHQFGQPVIEKTNILAETIYELYTAGESKQFLSNLYDVSPSDIDSAIALFKREAA